MKPSCSKLLIIFLLSLLFVPLITSAACPSIPCPSGQICISNPLCANTFAELIDAIVGIIRTLALAIAPLMIIIGAFYFLTAAGDPAKINTAKQIILWTLIGLLIIILASGIIALFRSTFGV